MAQNSAKNKQTAKKKTTTKSPSNKKKNTKKKNQQRTLFDIVSKREFGSTLTFISGILLLIIALFSGGNGSLWNTVHSFYFALFGICGYFIPLSVLFFGVTAILNKQKRDYAVKASEIFMAFVLICGFLHISNFASPEIDFNDSIKKVFEISADNTLASLKNGGFLGAVFGGSIYQLCKSKILAFIILAIVFIADLMLLFGITLIKLFTKLEKPAKKVGEFTEVAIEKSKNDIQRIRAEKAEERALKVTAQEKDISSKNKNVNPAKIVSDFMDNYSEQQTFFNEKSSPEKSENTKTPENNTVEESNIFTFNLSESLKSIKSAPITPENNDTEIIAEAENNANDMKSEKPEPLSEKEKQALKDSLDNAVTAVQTVKYVLPPIDCLNKPKETSDKFNENELKMNGEKLIAALGSFNVSATICGVVPGPTVTRYELSPAPGVKISKFVGLADDLALHMAAPAGLRIEAPIPNKAAIGIEIPNRNKTAVTFREIIESDKFKSAPGKLTVALGKDISGTPMFSNLSKMPHLLVAGTTGSGKSVCLNSMIVSLLYNATPDEVKLLLIDPKQVEFGIYNGLPHLLVPVVSDPRKAAGALGWAVTEMLSRYKTLNANGVRDIGAYNSLCDEREDLVKMPHIVIFIDELADLMTVAPAEVEDSIQRLAQMARAAGMHLVVATQRPSVDVITGVIKSNIPSRIALTVKSYVDSRIIIDTAGAEKLMGNGDMLYYPVGVPKPVRIQGCYLSDGEIENVVTFIKANTSTNYDDAVQQEIERQAVSEKKKSEEGSSSSGIDANDELLMRAIELFVGAPEKASISALQRHLGLGFAKAGRLMDTLEQKGIVGPHMGSKPRNVLVTKAQWYEMNAMNNTPTREITETEENRETEEIGELN